MYQKQGCAAALVILLVHTPVATKKNKKIFIFGSCGKTKTEIVFLLVSAPPPIPENSDTNNRHLLLRYKTRGDVIGSLVLYLNVHIWKKNVLTDAE